jgi:hypothetical protein
MKHMLTALKTMQLRLEYDERRLKFAFKFNSRRYNMDEGSFTTGDSR